MQGNTVQIRVQVIDISPQVLDLRVPTYLKAADLSQRIARDAGLQSHWPNRQRRLYWLRARGRLLREEESLQDLGVIDNELVFILPQPQAELGVIEQDPDYPKINHYAGRGYPLLIATVSGILAWSVAWGMALTASQHWAVANFPAFGLGILSIAFSRHAWGGRASRVRVFLVGGVMYLLALFPAFLVPMLLGPLNLRDFFLAFAPGILTGIVGLMLAWVAWWGAVEPLPPRKVIQDAKGEESEQSCAICRQDIAEDVSMLCQYKCGRPFHKGCHAAKKAIYRGNTDFCEVCNARLT